MSRRPWAGSWALTADTTRRVAPAGQLRQRRRQRMRRPRARAQLEMDAKRKRWPWRARLRGGGPGAERGEVERARPGGQHGDQLAAERLVRSLTGTTHRLLNARLLGASVRYPLRQRGPSPGPRPAAQARGA